MTPLRYFQAAPGADWPQPLGMLRDGTKGL